MFVGVVLYCAGCCIGVVWCGVYVCVCDVGVLVCMWVGVWCVVCVGVLVCGCVVCVCVCGVGVYVCVVWVCWCVGVCVYHVAAFFVAVPLLGAALVCVRYDDGRWMEKRSQPA